MKTHFIQEHGFTSKPATPPLKSSLKDGKGSKVKFVKSQRLVEKVHSLQTKKPKHQPANDSEDESNSSIGSDSSMSVEAVPRALIWRNDTSNSKKGRMVSHLRNVSTIHSVRKSRRLSEKRTMISPMQSHHQDRRQLCYQLQHQQDGHHHNHRQPRQRSRHHRHSRAGYNDQLTQRRRGRRSTTSIAKRNQDHDSRKNTSPLFTSTHAEQSLKASDLLPESRNGIVIAYRRNNPRRYQLRRVPYGSVTLTKQYNHNTCITLIKTTDTLITWYMNHQNAEACGDRGHTPWQRSYTNMTTKTRDNVFTNANHRIDFTRTTRTHSINT
jgi:hypothetical protein